MPNGDHVTFTPDEVAREQLRSRLSAAVRVAHSAVEQVVVESNGGPVGPLTFNEALDLVHREHVANASIQRLSHVES